MEVQTHDSVKYRGLRQLACNLVAGTAGLLLLIVLAVAVVADPPSTSSAEWGGFVTCVVGAVILVALLLRMRVAFTVEIAPEVLTYRTLLRTVKYGRSDVVGVGLQDRHRGLPMLSQPYLNLRDGRTVWLADMGQGKLIAPESTMQSDLVQAVENWIR
jgi:uncharacterized membrane protein YeaQ/YmgE (transglycosylase-associated protein family)